MEGERDVADQTLFLRLRRLLEKTLSQDQIVENAPVDAPEMVEVDAVRIELLQAGRKPFTALPRAASLCWLQ